MWNPLTNEENNILKVIRARYISILNYVIALILKIPEYGMGAEAKTLGSDEPSN